MNLLWTFRLLHNSPREEQFNDQGEVSKTKTHSSPLNPLKGIAVFVNHDPGLKNVRYTPESSCFNSCSKVFDTTWDLSSASG